MHIHSSVNIISLYLHYYLPKHHRVPFQRIGPKPFNPFERVSLTLNSTLRFLSPSYLNYDISSLGSSFVHVSDSPLFLLGLPNTSLQTLPHLLLFFTSLSSSTPYLLLKTKPIQLKLYKYLSQFVLRPRVLSRDLSSVEIIGRFVPVNNYIETGYPNTALSSLT